LELYRLLEALAPGPMVTLNRIVALAEVDGPLVGLRALDDAGLDHYRVAAVRAHLLERSDAPAAAREEYRRAARLTLSLPERQYLEAQVARLA
jgi:predicted RNA polymerase sigma factor